MSGSARRFSVKGTSGAGKSTLAAEVARAPGLTYIEVDALHHGPNWSEPTIKAFRTRVREAMAAADRGWVIDGNYDSKLGDTVVAEADTIVWLDLPLGVKLLRLWTRTVDRIANQTELWNGNRDSWRGAFIGRESLFAWTVRSHIRHRRKWPARFSRDSRLVRLRSDEDVRHWLREQTEPSRGNMWQPDG